jgi:hypothetical protein
MKQCLLYSVLICLLAAPLKSFSSNIDRTGFYAAMRSGDLDAINKQLEIIESDTAHESRAFEGALLMKKAGVVKGPFKKLKLFKKGHALLEKAVEADEDNPEFRFLRLMIQENAPGMLNYNDNIKTDRELLQSTFKSLPPELQETIIEYSKTSKVITPENFKG